MATSTTAEIPTKSPSPPESPHGFCTEAYHYLRGRMQRMDSSVCRKLEQITDTMNVIAGYYTDLGTDCDDPMLRAYLIVDKLMLTSRIAKAAVRGIISEEAHCLEDRCSVGKKLSEEEDKEEKDRRAAIAAKQQKAMASLEHAFDSIFHELRSLGQWVRSPSYDSKHPFGRHVMKTAESSFRRALLTAGGERKASSSSSSSSSSCSASSSVREAENSSL